MATLRIETAEVFEPLLAPARYKGAWGGRGSGKSHFFAELLVEECLANPGTRAVCIREVQKTLKESSKRLIEDKIRAFGLAEGHGFRILNEWIETPGGGVITFTGMQDHTAESIKSLEGYRLAWVEEAQSLSARSLQLLRPTIRIDGSELWFSWNPRRKTDAVDAMLRGPEKPTGAVVVRANWSDNPRFPAVLEQERQDCIRSTPEQYDHVWQGGYASVLEGAYFARSLAQARAEGRIGAVAADPLLTLRAFVDIGGTGARADAFVIWIAQFVGSEIRVLDYYEAVGQPLAAHLHWMRERKYTPARCSFWLPHDGDTNDKVFDVSYASALREADYDVTVVPNQGKGAAKQRIEAARRLFPSIRFNEATTQPGIDALGWYHEKRDEARNVGLGPEHDWASHGCFHGSTKVLTRYGTCRIMDLPETGEVLTPCGWKQYIAPRITKRAARLVEVRFESGYSVKCTPDHLFLTGGGWRSAQSLRKGFVIQSSLTGSRSTSEGRSTAFGRAIVTIQRAAAAFIAMCGRRLSAISRPGATSTIATGMPLTTDSRIWSASMPSSISHWSASPGQLTARVALATRPAPLLPNGTSPPRGVNGIAGRPSGRKVGRSGRASRASACTAAWVSWVSCAKAATRRCIAALHARWPHIARAANRTNGLLRIERVRHLNETADVWDITVPDGHWFSLENGAVVHNSDAFGLMCVAYEEPRAKRRTDDGGSTHWMS